MPSLASSSSSIITSLPLALRSLGSYLIGQASVITKRAASARRAFVLDDDDHLLALVLDLAGRDVGMPLEQVERIRADGHAPLQRDVAVLGQAGQLADVRRIGALAIVDRVDRRLGDRDLAEAGLRDAVDLQAVAEIAKRIDCVPWRRSLSAGLQRCSGRCGR